MVKKVSVAAVLCGGVLLLGGCEMIGDSTWEPQTSSAISIDEDGGITEVVNETLDESYYSSSELQEMINSEVADYNSKNGEDSVVVKEFAVEEKSVHLEMEYAAAEDYASFNNVEFFYGSMINAQLEGYLFDGSFKKVRDGVVQGSSVSGSEVLKNMAAEVLIVQAPLEVKVPGTVIYTTTNAEVSGADVVNATGEANEEEETGLVLPSSAVYKGAEASYEEQVAANRVYIIFEKE